MISFASLILLGWVAVVSSLDFTDKFESTGQDQNVAMARQDDPSSGQEKIINEFTCDVYHHKFSVPSRAYQQEVSFRLGQEGQSTYQGKSYKYLYDVEGDKLKATFNFPDGRVVQQEYDFNPEGFTKSYKTNSDDRTATVAFKKVSE